jgi:hypothetical protein
MIEMAKVPSEVWHGIVNIQKASLRISRLVSPFISNEKNHMETIKERNRSRPLF